MSVKQDKSRGTWYFVVDVAGLDGKRRQMYRRGFRTRKAALEAEAVVVSEQARGMFVRPSRSSVEAYLRDEWLPSRRAAVKPSTAASYAQMVDSYVVPYIGNLELGKVDGATLNALYARLLTDGRTGASGRRGGLSAKSVRNVHGLLHRAFADAVRWRRMAVNPCDAADQPRRPEVELDIWTSDQMRDFLAATRNDREWPLWRLLLTTGMRRGELLGLHWRDVDLSAGRLTIRQTRGMVESRVEAGTPKTRSGARTVSIDPATVAAVKVWKSQQAADRLIVGATWPDTDGLVVLEADGTAVHPQVLTRRFKAAAKRAGLPVVRLHDTRHSYATAALAARVPVKVLSQRLGHADVTVTLRLYAHVMPGDDEAAAATAAAVLGD